MSVLDGFIKHPIEIPDVLKECFAKTVIGTVPFKDSFPKEILDGPLIVCTLIRRWTGKEKKETKRGRLRGIYSDDLDPGKINIYYGQWQSTIFQFDILHTSASDADKLMVLLEKTIKECQPTLSNMGIDSFMFEEQLKDTSLPIPKSIVSRSLRYMATMTVYTEANIARMREIVIKTSQRSMESTIDISKSSTYVDTVQIPRDDILSIRPKDPNADAYVVEVDYELTDANTNRKSTTITWTAYGLHPNPGDTFEVVYSTLSDPVTTVIH